MSLYIREFSTRTGTICLSFSCAIVSQCTVRTAFISSLTHAVDSKWRCLDVVCVHSITCPQVGFTNQILSTSAILVVNVTLIKSCKYTGNKFNYIDRNLHWDSWTCPLNVYDWSFYFHCFTKNTFTCSLFFSDSWYRCSKLVLNLVCFHLFQNCVSI